MKNKKVKCTLQYLSRVGGWGILSIPTCLFSNKSRLISPATFQVERDNLHIQHRRLEPKKKTYNLEDRLVKFACLCLEVCDLLPPSRTGQNLNHQLSKSGTASALNYGEAQAAESAADFIHKMKLVLKEIRETRVNLRIIIEKPLVTNEKCRIALEECNELMAIFLKSIETAKRNQNVKSK